MPPRFLVAASETDDQRNERRQLVGASSDETFAETLRTLAPGCHVDAASCVDAHWVPTCADLMRYDAVFFAGSPISMHAETRATATAATFMRNVFEAGVPSFGSCAGLQIAAVAAGGSVRPRRPTLEAGFTRGIVATDAGRTHPMLRGRPLTWDAPTMHSDEVSSLPSGAVVLAHTNSTPMQAAEIRHRKGVFWGVQYHPELTLAEIAAALRRQADDLIDGGLAMNEQAVADHAARIDALGKYQKRRDLAWQLGIDQEIIDPKRRMTELRNFIQHFVGGDALHEKASQLERA